MLVLSPSEVAKTTKDQISKKMRKKRSWLSKNLRRLKRCKKDRPAETEVKITPLPFPSRLKTRKKKRKTKTLWISLERLRIPPKCKDPGVFTIPCKFGNLSVSRAMLDLGDSINVFPYSLFRTIGLADRSLVYPKGVLEDVLVQLNELIFPIDFYILDIGDDAH
uniref:Aspartic peptidase DDI1-type domain-containing protein n=1 Tax=Lactuca sativa TaxID=4236 RepID=A0A9R1XKH8_LACSA|nr:hypothetical protein LSAT_V11C400218330 [Lactuca sativa]